MPTYNFTGRPIRMLTPDSPEIPPDGYAEVVTVGAPERDVLVLNDGREVPGIVSRPGNEAVRAPWLANGPGEILESGPGVKPIKLTKEDIIIVNAQVALVMEARGLRVDAAVWSPGETTRTPEGVVYAAKPVRHGLLTHITVWRG